jgi:dTDP-4-amino-4,6-dideoxygalactose transaminase
MIPVTKTFLPPLEEYNAILKRAWDKQWITNRGELVLELEQKLKDHLSVPNIIVTNNGTVPLQIAIKALGIDGEIITTPFSYVATTAAIVWENCTPVFVDIDPDHLTIDETKIEAAITSRTKAILATHVFGNPCNVDVIESIAQKHDLKVIYDAAHCFDVTYKGKSVFAYGDVSTCSFHATKLFHTGEGGAMFTNSSELHHKLYYHHNFGHKGQLDFHGLGINAKISELQAAMGLAVFPYIDTIVSSRKKAVDQYRTLFKDVPVRLMKIREGTEWNNSYFPVVFKSEEQLLRVQAELNKQEIIPRRYFYPSLSSLNYVKPQQTPVADQISASILCLPLYHSIQADVVKRIVETIVKTIGDE